ncbi:hypothetical protein L9F63_012164 [Diploptera punctata]|uniref:C2H2-type domain-containing protein n=1 Tax=Diploptera punctata TaxID=6984 RepID=A0AAD8AF99_DIPPU|nr:hypothetical protein L9F63_012164 [Diploptera punctata]
MEASPNSSTFPSLFLESVVTSTKISVLPTNTSRIGQTSRPNVTSRPTACSSMRFDRNNISNYSTSYMSSTFATSNNTVQNMKSSVPNLSGHNISGQQISKFPALPSQSLSCEQCGRVYACEYTLKRHLRLECGKEATLQCPVCSRRTKHKHSLLRHINKFHPDITI